jgi:hypothetical protein
VERARGVDVMAVLLIAVLVLELAGAVIGQRMIWAYGNGLVIQAFRSPLVPAALVLAAVAFGLEGVIKRRDDAAMVARLIAMLLVVVALPVAAVIGGIFGFYTAQHPVG